VVIKKIKTGRSKRRKTENKKKRKEYGVGGGVRG